MYNLYTMCILIWPLPIVLVRYVRRIYTLYLICIVHKVQPIADRVAQHLEIISKNFRMSTRRTMILMGFIIYYLVLIVNPMGRILVRWNFVGNNLEILCHPICNWLYNMYTSYIMYNLYTMCILLWPLPIVVVRDVPCIYIVPYIHSI